MDVLEMRVPDYFGKACAQRIPQNYAVEKSEYIEDRKETIAQIDVKIDELTQKLNRIADPKNAFYQNIAKSLEKCYEIRRNCEASIVLVTEQLKINKR